MPRLRRIDRAAGRLHGDSCPPRWEASRPTGAGALWLLGGHLARKRAGKAPGSDRRRRGIPRRVRAMGRFGTALTRPLSGRGA